VTLPVPGAGGGPAGVGVGGRLVGVGGFAGVGVDGALVGVSVANGIGDSTSGGVATASTDGVGGLPQAAKNRLDSSVRVASRFIISTSSWTANDGQETGEPTVTPPA